jgi:DNA polymerase I-like protein with 3'-5' exonuclease and polymerase domains/uracil-DNA glycosylase
MPSIRPFGSTSARIMIVGDFPHEMDLRNGYPFVGGGAWELTKIFQESGMIQPLFKTLVCRERPYKNRIEGLIPQKKSEIDYTVHVLCDAGNGQSRFMHPDVLEGIELLKQEIALVQPNVVLALGNLALWALTGQWGVKDWRSSIMESTLIPGLKVIPSFSPEALMKQWSLRPLLVHDCKRVVRQAGFPEIRRTEYNFQIRPSFEQAKQCLIELYESACDRCVKLSLDIETRAGHISCIAIAWSDKDAICIPFMDVIRGNYWSSEFEESFLVHLLYQICQRATVIGQNWNYDAQFFLKHWLFVCPRVEDTMLKQHSCFSNLDKNLSFLSSMYCEDHLHWKDDRTNWTEGPKGEGEEAYWIYNCTDAVRTYAINNVLDNVVGAMGLQKVASFQQTLAPAVLRTMDKGVRIDSVERGRLIRETEAAIKERETWLFDVIGGPINIKSPKQMQDFFYREMKQPVVLQSKTKTPSTDDTALHTIASREPLLLGVTRKISELRSLGVFLSTFLLAPTDSDARMRTMYGIAGTETYRFNSKQNAFGTGMNLQNVPKGGETEDGGLTLPNVRNMFVPDPGHTFFDIDLDSADLRIVAGESDCQWLIAQFAAGRKPYVEMMKEYYQDPSIDKTHRSYPMFKAVCHASNYRGTAAGISPRIGLDVAKVQQLQDWYFGLCPEIRKWQEDITKQVNGRRWIENVLGYRIHFFDRITDKTLNEAVAWKPQSTVGCLINRAYLNIHNNLPEVDILLQVHDSLAGQYPTSKPEMLEAIVKESEIVLPYNVPMIIPVGIKSSVKSWGECD